MTKVQPLLDRLAVQLANVDADASDTVRESQALTRGTPLAGGLQKLAKAVSDYEFEKAETALQALNASKSDKPVVL